MALVEPLGRFLQPSLLLQPLKDHLDLAAVQMWIGGRKVQRGKQRPHPVALEASQYVRQVLGLHLPAEPAAPRGALELACLHGA